MTETIQGVNVAPQSTSGHYVQGAEQVINLDKTRETFFVNGKSQLVTKNHTSLKQETDCLITSQVVYNPFAKMFERSKD